MPNHVINEVIFRGVSAQDRHQVLLKVGGEKSRIDFEVLLPIPLNYWWGSVSQAHEKHFPGNALDWCTKNWSTKWNAYGLETERYQPVVQTDDALTLTFQTAWGPPMGWLVALFNTARLSFEYCYLSESGAPAMRGAFTASTEGIGDKWSETEADEPIARHLHKLLWGVEEFPDEASLSKGEHQS